MSTLIHRHGKPSAGIVPVAIGRPVKKKRHGMTPEEIAALHATFEGQAIRTSQRSKI